MGGGSSVDITNMSLPVKLFTYAFRPLPFEAHNLTSLAGSLDNTVLLLVFIMGAWVIFKKRGVVFPRAQNRVFLWAYGLLSWGLLAMVTANLGIAVRQKWMFLPMLLFLLMSRLGHRQAAPEQRSRLGGPRRTAKRLPAE